MRCGNAPWTRGDVLYTCNLSKQAATPVVMLWSSLRFRLLEAFALHSSTMLDPACLITLAVQLRELFQNPPLLLRQHVGHLHADFKAMPTPRAFLAICETPRHASILQHQRRPVLCACTHE